jgi:2-polyprenyl-6-methoxyphenol hydroxylase-like FAD-dependent oxidoreductase
MRIDAELDVLVVGAGPVGLTLGCELLRRGVRARVIDELEAPTQQSRATDLQARSLEILEAMGVLEDFVRASNRVEGVSFYGGGERLLRLGFGQIDGPHPYLLSLPQASTEAILRARLAALGGAVERGVRLVALTDHGDQVTATVATRQGEEEIRARWVVGCDGASSTVRRLLGLGFAGMNFAESFLIADVIAETELARDEVHLFLHPAGFLTAFWLPERGLLRLFFDAHAGLTAPPGLDDLRALVAERAHLPVRLAELRWTSLFHVHQRMVEAYRVGSVFLAGNAAHVHSPAGGQGMNTGIQDAFNLGWKLALASEGLAGDRLLDSYHAERHPVGKAILRETELATRSSMIRSRPLAMVRDLATRLTGELEPVVSWLQTRCAELDLAYPMGTAVGERSAPLLTAPVRADRSTERASLADRSRFDHGPHAGERAPDVAGLSFEGREVALREITRHGGFTLLLFDGQATTAAGYANLDRVARRVAPLGGWVRPLAVLRRAPDPGQLDCPILVDPAGALHARYGASSECLYLVRPDGHIGFRCQPADESALAAHLASWVEPRSGTLA